MPEQQLRFEQWANFYAITSATAATLLGLLFVVISLAAERGRKDAPSIRSYLTPTVIYFSSVLLIGALLAIPNQTRLTALICICLGGILGVAYCGSLALRRGSAISFYDRSDILPYVLFPFAAYSLMAVAGLLLLRRPQTGLDLVAAAMLALLCIAIRNSWAIAITIVSSRS